MISVIIPTYNSSKTIKRTLDSVFANQFPNFEVIIVDDGSSDQIEKAIKSFLPRPNFHFFKKKHQGVPSARNFALKKARGEYLFFLDADDTIDPNALSSLSQHARGRVLIGLSIFQVYPRSLVRLSEPDSTPIELFLNNLVTGNANGFICRYLFERSIIEKHHLSFPESLSAFEDTPFLLSYLCAAKIDSVRYLPDSSLYYYQHPTSITNSSANLARNLSDYLSSFFLVIKTIKSNQDDKSPIDKSCNYYLINSTARFFEHQVSKLSSPRHFSFLKTDSTVRSLRQFLLAHSELRLYLRLYLRLIPYLPYALFRSLLKLRRLIAKLKHLSRSTHV